MNPDLFAGFIGTLAQFYESNSQNYVVGEGFTYEDGTCYPTNTHANGKAFDTNYLITLARQNQFVEAMRLFGISYQGRGNSGWQPNIDHGSYLPGHTTHLHSGLDTFNEDYI